MEQSTSKDAFEVFAVDGTLVGAPVRVIVNKDVSVVDDDAGVSRHGTVVEFRKDLLPTWTVRDQLIDDTGAAYRLQEVIFDDGYIVKIFCTGATK